MDKKQIEDKELELLEIMEAERPDAVKALEIIGVLPSVKADEVTMLLLDKLSKVGDFAGTFEIVSKRASQISTKLQGAGVRDVLRKSTKDRLVAAFIDSCDFADRPVEEAVARLARLLSFKPGMLVLSPSWGLGEIKRLDYFYRKITVDFNSRKNQQLTFQTACETLTPAPEDHVLVLAKIDPPRIKAMIESNQAELVMMILKSYGDVSLVRLEDLLVSNGFIKSAGFKDFWEKARVGLKKSKLVDVPIRRTDPLHLKNEEESYGESWFNALGAMTDPKEILTAIRTLDAVKKMPPVGDPNRAKVEERMEFAVKGVRNVDDALYAQLACTVTKLGLSRPSAETMRSYMWDYDRYLNAARTMPAREIRDFIYFLTNQCTDAALRDRLLDAVPQMSFQCLSEFLEMYVNDEVCEERVAAYLCQAKAPATLVTYVVARRNVFVQWKKLPPYITILAHAIALGEGRQNGEVLRMQNIVRRLFADEKWLKETLESLESADRALFFERFQASIAWDPATHNLITHRMTRLAPELASHLAKRDRKAEVIEKITSFRSYAERKAAYHHLVNVEMPANVRDIEEARSKGDLRENSEYQYAKDKERELHAKQEEMSRDLEQVKPTDFADIIADSVKAGTMVTLRLADGSEKTYTVLGEWDNNLEMNIISHRTRLASNMLGKKTGDQVEVTDAAGVASMAGIVKVSGLTQELAEYVKLPEGMAI